MAWQALAFLRLPLRFKILIDRKGVRKNNNVFIYPDKKNRSAKHRGTAGINRCSENFHCLMLPGR